MKGIAKTVLYLQLSSDYWLYAPYNDIVSTHGPIVVSKCLHAGGVSTVVQSAVVLFSGYVY